MPQNTSTLTLFRNQTFRMLWLAALASNFGGLVQGTVVRHEVPNVWALKFVMDHALGGGGPQSLRADNLGKTLGGALLRLEIDVPDDVAAAAPRNGRRAPLPN